MTDGEWATPGELAEQTGIEADPQTVLANLATIGVVRVRRDSEGEITHAQLTDGAVALIEDNGGVE